MMYKLKHFRFNAIKESFDQLPTAVCFLTATAASCCATGRCTG